MIKKFLELTNESDWIKNDVRDYSKETNILIWELYFINECLSIIEKEKKVSIVRINKKVKKKNNVNLVYYSNDPLSSINFLIENFVSNLKKVIIFNAQNNLTKLCDNKNVEILAFKGDYVKEKVVSLLDKNYPTILISGFKIKSDPVKSLKKQYEILKSFPFKLASIRFRFPLMSELKKTDLNFKFPISLNDLFIIPFTKLDSTEMRHFYDSSTTDTNDVFIINNDNCEMIEKKMAFYNQYLRELHENSLSNHYFTNKLEYNEYDYKVKSGNYFKTDLEKIVDRILYFYSKKKD